MSSLLLSSYFQLPPRSQPVSSEGWVGWMGAEILEVEKGRGTKVAVMADNVDEMMRDRKWGGHASQTWTHITRAFVGVKNTLKHTYLSLPVSLSPSLSLPSFFSQQVRYRYPSAKQSIHQKHDLELPDSYKHISFFYFCIPIFNYLNILNKRLSQWT